MQKASRSTDNLGIGCGDSGQIGEKERSKRNVDLRRITINFFRELSFFVLGPNSVFPLTPASPSASTIPSFQHTTLPSDSESSVLLGPRPLLDEQADPRHLICA
jgi:hypothetical protein